MKKALIVLGFAMLTTVTMAQTKKMVLPDNNPVRANISVADFQQPVDYKSSIFTKDGEVTVRMFQFDAQDMTGINYGSSCRILAGDVIGNDTVTEANGHGVEGNNTYWIRVNSVDSIPEVVDGQIVPGTGSVSFVTTYPESPFYGAASGRMGVYMGAQNGIEEDNGFMFVSLIEHRSDANDYHVYFSLPAVTLPAGTEVFDVDFRQYFRKFYDNTYIDYKVVENGVDHWYAVEVNVRGIDVEVNGTGAGHYRVTMPFDLATYGTAELRFRNYAPGGYATHGYMWAVDNVAIVVPENSTRWQFHTEGFLNGFYGTLPQGFNIPLGYVVNVRNNGIADLTGNSLNVTHIYNNVSNTFISDVEESDLPWGDPRRDSIFRINESGFMHPTAGFDANVTFEGVTQPYVHSWPEYYSAYGVDEAALEALGFQHRGLPTQNPGLNQFVIGATNEQGVTTTFDTMAYWVSPMVEGDDNTGAIAGYRWANDNGVVPGGSEYGYQFTGPYFTNGNPTDDPEDNLTHHYQSGYFTMTRFNSPSVIPTDQNGEPWVIRGMELVTSTNLTSAQVQGVRITPIVYTFAADDTGAYDFEWFSETGFRGNEVYRVPATAAPEDIEDNYGVLTPDATPYAFDILFPGQPAMRPNYTYMLGYEINETGTFSVAQTQYSYKEAPGTFVGYYNDPDVAPYYRQFSPQYKVYDVYTYDPIGSDNGSHTLVGWNVSNYPMIRAIVGPKIHVDTFFVDLDCQEGNEESGEYFFLGVVGNQTYNFCGYTDSLPQNQSSNYYVFPGTSEEFATWSEVDPDDYFTISEDDGTTGHWVIDAIYDNNIAVDLSDTNLVETTPYYVYWEGHTPADGAANEWAPATTRTYYRYTVSDIRESHTITAHATYVENLAIGEIEDYINLSLAPNPATSQVVVNVTGFSGKAQCSILDMSGREVYATDVTAGKNVINLNGVAAGAYFVRITNSEFSKVEKLIVR